MLNASFDLSIVVIVSNASIKNNIAMSIAYVHSFNSLLKKTLYHAINVTTTEAELFAIRCGINQAIQIPGTSHIIIITDALHMAQRIFDSTIYCYILVSIIGVYHKISEHYTAVRMQGLVIDSLGSRICRFCKAK